MNKSFKPTFNVSFITLRQYDKIDFITNVQIYVLGTQSLRLKLSMARQNHFLFYVLSVWVDFMYICTTFNIRHRFNCTLMLFAEKLTA